MTLRLRKNTPSSNGILTEVQNIVGGVLVPLTNEQVDTNFSSLNIEIKTEKTRAETAEATELSRALASEATKVNLNGGNTVTGAQDFTNADVSLTTSSALSNNAIAATNEYVDSAVLIEKSRAETVEATKVSLSAANTITGQNVFTGNISVPTPSLGSLSTDAVNSGWVRDFLSSVPWNRTITQTAQNTFIAPSTNFIKFPNPDIPGVRPQYLGLDLGRPGARFANIYAAKIVLEPGTIVLGEAELKGSSEGGVVLPTNTAIGAESNVIPANLASSLLDQRWSKTGLDTPIKISLPILNSNIVSPPQAVGLLPNGSVTSITESNVSGGLIDLDAFLGFASVGVVGGIPAVVTISGKVSGFTNLDFGQALNTVATIVPVLNKNDALSLTDGTNTVTVPSPGVSGWSNAITIKNALNAAATSDFKFNISATSTILTFTAKNTGVQIAPTLTQTTEAIQEVFATYTVDIADPSTLSSAIAIFDGTNTITLSDFSTVTNYVSLSSALNSLTGAPGNLAFTITATSTGLLFTYNAAAPITTHPTVTDITVVAGVTGVTGVPTVTTTPNPTITTVGRVVGSVNEYFLNTDGSLTTTSTSTNVKIGVGISSTELFLYSTSTIDNYVTNYNKIELTDLSVGTNASASGEGSLAYNNTTGLFTFTPPKDIVDATLTGTPIAPTASIGTNSTQIANTSFVKNAIDNLIANSPAALDTLNELAAAINDDANFATTLLNTINTGLALKAPIANPVFTGAATVPTPSNSSNDNTVATTAFVKNTTPPLENAALTGVPTAPTAAPSINNTQIASTEYVTIAVAQGGGGVNIDGGTATSIRNTTTITLDGGGAS